ncbi:MAG: eukaryotic-like serine/threonine-protein kinase [Blastocatellia bacterium]|nr:eukaryotic-like serine/threonine-protein kinase [Blastocatellia bacterium]
MLKSAIKLLPFGALVLTLILHAGSVLAQDPSVISSSLKIPASSDGAMDGVNLQRTNSYPGKSAQLTNKVLWKSPKFFVMNYEAALTKGVDPASLEYAEVGFSDPVIADGLLYFRLGRGVRQYVLFALDQSNGAAVWRFESKMPLSAPAVAGDTLYLESTEGILYALDARTGREKWRYSAKDEHWTVGASPAVADGMIYFTGLAGNLNALDMKTRQPKWVFKSKGTLTAPTVTESTIYVGSEKGFIYALDKKSGEEQWNFKAKAKPNNPVIMDGSVYFRTEAGVLFALDAKTGQEKWNTKVGGKVQSVSPITTVTIGTSLAVHNNSIFFAGAENETDFLYAIDSSNGQQRWKFATNGPCRAPIVTDDIVYVGCVGKLFAIDAQNGTMKWGIEAKTESEGKTVKVVPSSPALNNGALFYVTDEGFVYALQ